MSGPRSGAYSAAGVTFSPSAIGSVRAWYASGSPAPWLGIEAGDVRLTIASDHGAADIDALRAVLRAGLAALDLLAAESPAAGPVIVHAPWPPEAPE